jgi:hypothetical protein
MIYPVDSADTTPWDDDDPYLVPCDRCCRRAWCAAWFFDSEHAPLLVCQRCFIRLDIATSQFLGHA